MNNKKQNKKARVVHDFFLRNYHVLLILLHVLLYHLQCLIFLYIYTLRLHLFTYLLLDSAINITTLLLLLSNDSFSNERVYNSERNGMSLWLKTFDSYVKVQPKQRCFLSLSLFLFSWASKTSRTKEEEEEREKGKER